MFGIKESLLDDKEKINKFPWDAFRVYEVDTVKGMPWAWDTSEKSLPPVCI